MVAQTQMFPKREAVQQLKDRLQAWCDEENRREQEGEGAPLPGGKSPGKVHVLKLAIRPKLSEQRRR